ncbi:MAG TPA: AsmA-like C-terminal region-containing protein [Rariglobus sp.]|jgi:hypothetical protein|nr:AsmA-like C-terminal region-containing protein [Rariglobus sp.]
MTLLRKTWHVSLWCTRKGCLLALWSLWMVMILTAGLQFYVIRSHELSLPGPVRRLIERRLAEKGFEVTFARGTFDFAGRILLEKVSFGPTSTPTPLVTAGSVYLKLDPWALAIRHIDLRSASASGVDFHLPAMLSPSGKDEILINDVDFTVEQRDRSVQIDHLTGRIGGLDVRVNGTLHLPAARDSSTTSSFIDKIVASYLRSGREVPALIARLSALESPTLDVDLVPTENRITTIRATLQAASLNLASIPEMKGAATGALIINAEMPVGGNASSLVRGDGRIASLTVSDLGSLQDVRFAMLGLYSAGNSSLALRWLDLQLASARSKDLETGPACITLIPRKDGWISADLSAGIAGSPWQVAASLNPKQSQGRIELDGRADSALLGLLGGFAKHDLAALLEPAVPASLHAAASFLPGWKLEQASGRLHSGPVRVGEVALDETGTEFSYRDGYVLCDNLVLRQGDSLAHGLYEMDTATMDFRFLLTGGLRPAGISGWFHDWWSRFWNDFDFSKAVPKADVDVAGRWGNLEATRVFVQAEGDATGLRGVPFDHVSTRLFVRPQWDDVLWFKVSRDGRDASGSFERLSDLEKETWTRMTFAIDSGLSLDVMKQMFGKDAEELLTPYRFVNAPRLKLSGHVESPASPGGAHQHIDIDLNSTGAAFFHDFPVSDLSFSARLRDTVLDLPTLALNIAGGHATGTAKVWGGEKDRRVSFDATLTGANLGEAINTIKIEPAAKAKPGEKTLAQRLANGRLNLSLNAEGLYDDFYSFKGKGRADISGAELGEINLFGLLSELLKKTVILNFTSFSLDKLNAQFAIDQTHLRFGSLKITGPSAAIDAKGAYDLQSKELDFKAKISPFDESKSIVGSTVGFVLSPISNALEVKLEGTMTKPDWVFVYGPTSLLRSIIGNGSTSQTPASSTKITTP